MTVQVLFTAREVSAELNGYYYDVGYVGTLLGGSFSWSEKILNVVAGAANTQPAPCQLLSDKSLLMCLDNESPYNIQMARYDSANGQLSSVLVSQDDAYYSPSWDEFSAQSNGTVVAGYVNDSGFQLKRSTDYGATWSVAYDLDCLKTILGSDYADVTAYVGGNYVFSITVDKSTDTFWLAIEYYATSTYESQYFLVASSTDGLTWTVKRNREINANFYYLSLSVSNSNVYCAYDYHDVNGAYVDLDYSSNGGTDWSTYTFTDSSRHTQSSIKVSSNEGTVLVYINNTDLYITKIYRSTDKTNWTKVLEINTNR
jgi:hypothetical protein